MTLPSPVTLPTTLITASKFPNPFKGSTIPVIDLVLPASVQFSNPQTKIPLVVDTNIEEVHESELEMTENPIEDGSDITDHSFMRPVQVRLRCGWSNSSLQALQQVASGLFSSATMTKGKDYVSDIYSQLQQIQTSRALIDITTGLLTYPNMLIRSVRATRDVRTSAALIVEAVCRQAIIVNTKPATVPPLANQKTPSKTAALLNLGTKNVTSATPAAGGSFPPSSWLKAL